ncbi:MAG TPA: hypothetical protein VID04_05750 [Methylomirabilota bacterium]
MRARIAMLSVLVALLPAAAALAQQASISPPIETAHTFLMAWGHEKWDELKTVAGEQVTVKVGDKTYSLQPGANSEVKLVFPFRGLSTVRADGAVKSIAIQDLGIKVGDNEVRGAGTLTLDEKDGSFRVVEVSTAK